MLRATITDRPSEPKWILQGRLVRQWAADLKTHWEETRDARRGRKSVVDLEDVTFIDSEGEGLLLEMAREGAQLVSRRFYVKDVLQSLSLNH